MAQTTPLGPQSSLLVGSWALGDPPGRVPSSTWVWVPGAGQDRHQFGLVFKLQDNFLKTALSNERRESLLEHRGPSRTGEDIHKTQLTDAHLRPGPQCLSIVQLPGSGSDVA